MALYSSTEKILPPQFCRFNWHRTGMEIWRPSAAASRLAEPAVPWVPPCAIFLFFPMLAILQRAFINLFAGIWSLCNRCILTRQFMPMGACDWSTSGLTSLFLGAGSWSLSLPQVATSQMWPCRTGGHIAQLAVLHGWLLVFQPVARTAQCSALYGRCMEEATTH